MLGRFLQGITEAEDYLAAIAAFQSSGPMTREEAQRVLEVYARYLPNGTEPGYARVCLAVDIMAGRTEEDAAFFAPLELEEGELTALFAARAVAGDKPGGSLKKAQELVKQVENEALSLAARVILARCALDSMAARWDLGKIRSEVAALSRFLTGCGSEVMDRYSDVIREVRLQCLK